MATDGAHTRTWLGVPGGVEGGWASAGAVEAADSVSFFFRAPARAPEKVFCLWFSLNTTQLNPHPLRRARGARRMPPLPPRWLCAKDAALDAQSGADNNSIEITRMWEAVAVSKMAKVALT